MDTGKDYYAILGVFPSVEGIVIRAAYKALAQRYHPDRNPGDPEAQAKMAEINEAYTVLSTPEKRKQYDLARTANKTGNFEHTSRPKDASRPPAPPKATGDAPTATMKRASAWRRFIARLIDLSWEGMAVGFSIGFITSFDSEWNTIIQQFNPLLFSIIVTPFAVLLDVVILNLFGTTPGKATLGLLVRDKYGKPLSSSDHFSRSVKFWTQGLGLSLPLISMISMLTQAYKVSTSGYTTYDRAQQFQILSKPIGIVRTLSSYVIVIILLFASSIFYSIEISKWQKKQIVAATTNTEREESSGRWSRHSAQGEVMEAYPTPNDEATVFEAQKRALQEHYQAIYNAHPDADSIVTSPEFYAWQEKMTARDQEAIAEILSKGTTNEIIGLLSLYKEDARAQRNTQPPTIIQLDRSNSQSTSRQADVTQRVYKRYPYLNDANQGGRWSGPFKAWLRELTAHGEPRADMEAARIVDEFRMAGFGACYPYPGTLERGKCN